MATTRKGLGVRELHIAIDDVDFDTIVDTLRLVLTIPKGKGIRGCAPCRSGLDRIVLEDPVIRTVNARMG